MDEAVVQKLPDARRGVFPDEGRVGDGIHGLCDLSLGRGSVHLRDRADGGTGGQQTRADDRKDLPKSQDQ
jgi:hypothetical protein